MTVKKILSAAAVSTLVTVPVAAQDSGAYVSVSGGLSSMINSANTGELTGDFTTGAGSTIPAGAVLPAGTSLGWDTGFDNGLALGGAIGYKYASGFRAEIELAYSKNSVNTHTAITVGGGGIGTQDAGILFTGSDNLGFLVRDAIAAGQGSSKNTAVMANVYYDFMQDSALSPYVGAGVGYLSNSILFNPSDVLVADDKSGGFAWQLIAGVSYDVSDTMAVFADYKYRQGDRANIALDLLPADLSIENKTNTFSLGLRFGF